MFRLFRLRLLLALAFVVGQSFALAHATQHEFANPGKTLHCEICAVAHAGAGLPGSPPTLPALQPVTCLPPALLPAATADSHRPTPRSRAPPFESI